MEISLSQLDCHEESVVLLVVRLVVHTIVDAWLLLSGEDHATGSMCTREEPVPPQFLHRKAGP